MARSGCIYGPSGSFKTSQVKWFSHYIAEKTGKATLLLSGDGGGWAACEPEIQAGMIEPYRIDTATIPLSLLQAISKGRWPRDTRESDPSRVDMVPIDYNKIGGIAVEGWTSLSSVIMRYLPAKGINVGGEDRSKLMFNVPIVVDGQVTSERFGSNTRGDYGFTQNMLYGLVTNFNSLPVEYVLYTALEAKTEDDDRSTIYGPAISGKKATAQAPSWVGDLIHAQDYAVERKIVQKNPATGKDEEGTVFETVVRYYYKKHPDPATGITFPAKPRVTPEKMTELEKAFPGGYFTPDLTGGFDRYMKKADELAAAQGDALKGWRDRMDARLGRSPKSAITAVK